MLQPHLNSRTNSVSSEGAGSQYSWESSLPHWDNLLSYFVLHYLNGLPARKSEWDGTHIGEAALPVTKWRHWNIGSRVFWYYLASIKWTITVQCPYKETSLMHCVVASYRVLHWEPPFSKTRRCQLLLCQGAGRSSLHGFNCLRTEKRFSAPQSSCWKVGLF